MIPESSSVWPASMFSLAVASTTLIFGRLADMYGGRRIYICGSVWLAIWSLVIGFVKNEILLNLSRAFQGIGASAMLPSGLMLMGSLYRPGTRKNMVFSIYGACVPFGFFLYSPSEARRIEASPHACQYFRTKSLIVESVPFIAMLRR
jgi:MFS family permease